MSYNPDSPRLRISKSGHSTLTRFCQYQKATEETLFSGLLIRWWARPDSNRQPKDYESPAPPLSYRPSYYLASLFRCARQYCNALHLSNAKKTQFFNIKQPRQCGLLPYSTNTPYALLRELHRALHLQSH